MYKSFVLFCLAMASLLLAQCDAAQKTQESSSMTLQQPTFAKSPAHYNTYVSGVPGGGSGIAFYLEVDVLPADVVLEKVFFRESVGKLMQGDGNYVARFRTDLGKGRDVVMSSDPNEEAVNTPPAAIEKFPFPLTENEAGISYREKGVLKYTKISNVKETEGIAYPSTPPRDKGGR